VAALLPVLLRAYAFEVFSIPSGSMVPTLDVYDRILVQKAFFNGHDVREGDIVVFTHPPLDRCPGPDGDLVKRVIALPGQTICSAGTTTIPTSTAFNPKAPSGIAGFPGDGFDCAQPAVLQPRMPWVRPGPRRTATSVTAAPCATGSREPVLGARTTLRSDK
jgi:hypothetical protein